LAEFVVRAVHQDGLDQAGLASSSSVSASGWGVVGAGGTTAKNDMAVRIAPRDDSGGGTVEIDARKVCGWAAALMALIAVAMEPSVPFLKPSGIERPEPSAVGLRLGGAGADGGPADEVGDVLGVMGSSSSVASGEAKIQHVAQERAREAQAGGDVVRTVKMRIHDQAFQPTVVRGFSKYTRITIITRSDTSRASGTVSRRSRDRRQRR